MPMSRRQKLKKARIAQRAYYYELRTQAIERLGKRCAACGIDDFDVLQIDHICPIKDRYRNMTKEYRRIRDMDDPYEEFQVLCANCHAKKTIKEGR